jgi:hypothetical protein
MTFQAYLDSVKAKTGLDPADFKRIAAEKGLLEPGVKTAQQLAWLKADYDLGPGHGMAIVSTFREQTPDAERFEKQFAGAKAHWRAVYDSLLATLAKHGPVEIAPTDTYISLLRGSAKFGIVALTADRMDVGIKLRGVPADGRFEASGNWNAMVTHRVRVTDAAQLDDELIGWLNRAYDAVGQR